jgi:hypothetical protein
MVITISVLPSFTYPSLSLCSHEVITVFYDLQKFLCPTIGHTTCVHCTTTLETGASDALMTFGAIHRYLETSYAEVTFDTMNFCAKNLPSDPAPPRPRLGRSSVM